MSRHRVILASIRIVVIAVLVMFAFAQFGGTNFPIPNKAGAVSHSITLVGNYNAWNLTTNPNPTITVTQGDTVTVSLSSVDYTHQFEIKVNKNGFPDCSPPNKCSSMFRPMMSTIYPFAVDFAPGNYTYYCTLHPGTMLGTLIVQGPDFALSANPASIGLLGTAAKGVSTITVTPSYGFNGQVMLTTSSSTGLTAVLNPTSINGGSGTSQLTVNSTAAGSYSVTVTGTSGILTHSATIAVSIATGDFSISLSPTTISVAVGASSNFNVQVQSSNGFSGTVQLAAFVSPTGTPTSATSSPASVSLLRGGTAMSVVTFSTSSSGPYSSPTPDGAYTLTVNATSGAITHSATATAVVRSTQTPIRNTSPPLPDQTALLASVAAAVLAVSATIGVLVVRNRLRNRASNPS
jgi:plastocyanin